MDLRYVQCHRSVNEAVVRLLPSYAKKPRRLSHFARSLGSTSHTVNRRSVRYPTAEATDIPGEGRARSAACMVFNSS